MTRIVAPIVEGHGDVAALPILLRRMNPSLQIQKPVRYPKNRLLLDDYLKRAASIAASNIYDDGWILLLLDADEQCAKSLGPSLEQKLSNMSKHNCRVVLAVREFEAWIVGGDPKMCVVNPDTAGNLKGLIRERYGVYSETVDQPRLIAKADLQLLYERSRSFRQLRKVVDEISSA